ncbi:LuxR family transcriptional regulator [Puerhibacterium puerhi]|uniref:LuxR family transcriptional regulator n=1 Tax=Puerhibacterium puerhi TaxID=2692623 RepID=UPI0013577A15|nr:LuxR family transcriptional regulator [Puerhibacterium puerhi]
MTVDLVGEARTSFARQRWAEAYARLAALDGGRDDDAGGVGPDDLVRLATAAVLLGRDVEGSDLFGRAHHAYLAGGDVEAAARCAFWAGMVLVGRGSPAQGGGWLARAARAAADLPADAVVRGYLRIPAALAAMRAARYAEALEDFDAALEVGLRHRDRDLLALARLGVGGTWVLVGQNAAGTAILDEVMVDVTAGQVSQIPSGIVYCAAIGVCRETYDLPRAREWTAALSRWCAEQPDLVPFRGECLVDRAHIMLVRGDWADALAECERAVERLADPPGQPELGPALYQQAEVLRLQGRLTEAEAAYRRANQHGWSPQPGLALLRLAQGRTDDAAGAVRRALAETDEPVARCHLLPAAVDVLLAEGDVAAARAAAEELGATAGQRETAWLAAAAAAARGAVLLAEERPGEALPALRRAWGLWQELGVPYEAARTRVAMGRGYRALGDEDAAQLELDAARWAFTELGARSDLACTEALSRRTAVAPGGLTPREVEVLRLVATGRTNRAVASELFLSEKTVARHLSNIFAKLDLPSRAAATAYAYEHHLL